MLARATLGTVYQRAVAVLRQQHDVDESLLSHIAPLGWNHINLTGDYRWQGDKRLAKRRFRLLRRTLPQRDGLSVQKFPFLEVTPDLVHFPP